MRPEEIHAELIAHGAIRSADDDGFIHHVLRRGADYTDLEFGPDGRFSLHVSRRGKLYSADGRDLKRLDDVWRGWKADGR